MTKIKTSELIGAQLDWAVAKCEAVLFPRSIPKYTTDWSQGGPILERENISFRKYHNPKSEAHGTYYARICRENGTMVVWYKTTGCQQTGPTPLIAAMRTFVASKLGDEVEIPEELA